MADQKTPFIDGFSLFYSLDSLEALFGTVKAKSKKGFFEALAKMEQAGQDGMSITLIKNMIHIGLNFDPSDKVSPEQASKLANTYYSENGYEALENILYDAFADSGLVDKNDREDGKKYIAERKRLISEQKFLELKELERGLEERKNKLEEEAEARKAKSKEADTGEATSTVSLSGSG